jgi:alpha-ketoglutarate-dependent taurine dioxygenase
VKPLAGAVDAKIGGVDHQDLDASAFDEIYEAWLRHQVVVLHHQQITPEQQFTFTRQFGGIHHHP